MRYTKNYRDPVCDTCACGRWSRGGTEVCEKLNLTVRQDGRITENFVACCGAKYERKEENW